MTARFLRPLLMTLSLLASACSTGSSSGPTPTTDHPIEAKVTAPTTIGEETAAASSSSVSLVDVEALLVEYGFERCGYHEPNIALTDKRREELFRATAAAGLGHSASMEPDSRVHLDLYVLDEQALKMLATLVDPSEVCVDGADPEGYVPDALSP